MCVCVGGCVRAYVRVCVCHFSEHLSSMVFYLPHVVLLLLHVSLHYWRVCVFQQVLQGLMITLMVQCIWCKLKVSKLIERSGKEKIQTDLER